MNELINQNISLTWYGNRSVISVTSCGKASNRSRAWL